MSDASNSGDSEAMPDWFAGDRRLFCVAGALLGDCSDNPEQLVAGCAVKLPPSIRGALQIGEHLKFTLAEIRTYHFGSMGFCAVDGQPGRGVWIRMHLLTRSEWHTPLDRPRPVRRRGS